MQITQRSASASPQVDVRLKPENGRVGLKYWRHDLVAGLVVSLVSLPLSSGIAIASGAPPIYGIISSIIAGLIFPFIGGSYVTISGPAAGLAPALMATMVALGGAGDADHVGAGYTLLLAVIFMAGLGQIILSKLKLARFAAIFPASAVEGMLGAIGILILVKALPLFFGYVEPTHAHGFFEYLAAIPQWWQGRSTSALAIGLITLVIMLCAQSSWAKSFSLFEKVPPHLFGVAAAIPLSLFLGLAKFDPRLLIQVPANPLSGLSLPNFAGLAAQPELWWAALVGMITLMLIDGVESLATAQAIDRIDPFKRQSEPNRLLMAMGLSNMVSSLVGGLTVIPGGVKSKTCIEAGGHTLWANFVNALFLLAFLFIAPGLIALIPKAALGAILVFTGWKMIHPSIGKHLFDVGPEQLFIYVSTILITLFTDLLIGVMVGSALKLLILAYHRRRALKMLGHRPGLGQIITDLFADPISGPPSPRTDHTEGPSTLHAIRPIVCFNAYRVHEHLAALGSAHSTIRLDIHPQVGVIDHTAMDGLLRVAETSPVDFQITGLSALRPQTAHPQAIHLLDPAFYSG